MHETISVGFGRKHVTGWSVREDAWLVECREATPDDRGRALPADRAVRWVRMCGLHLTSQVEDGVRDGQVLVLVDPVAFPVMHFDPTAVDLIDLLVEAESEPESEVVREPDPDDFIEVQVVDARGRARPSVRYELQFPNGEVSVGTTDANGMLRYERLDQAGDCVLHLPDVEARAA